MAEARGLVLGGLDPKDEPEDMGMVSGDPLDHGMHPAAVLRGIPAGCICGWHPANHPGYILADHLADFGVKVTPLG